MIRSATEADAPGILACLGAAFEPYRASYTPAGFADTVLTAETIRGRLQSMSVLVAISAAGEIIGTVGGKVEAGREGHIRGMAVLPAWAGSGVAQKLLEHIEQELRAAGCTHMTLDTTEPLTRAMRFYERNGYRRSGKIADFFGMPLIEYVKRLEG